MPAHTSTHTYGQILKSSALIGGSSVLNIAISIVRTKVLAVMLGPAGFGLMSLYGSVLDLAVSIAGMGISASGVRQIAEAAGTGDAQRIARTASVLRRTAVVLGLLGAVLLAALSLQISRITFGGDQHAGAIALLALAVFFRLLADGHTALIQGMRRIADLARMGVLGALLGAIISIVLVYVLGELGIVPALVGGVAMGFVVAYWYSRKVRIPTPALSRTDVRNEAGALLKLGFAFMASGCSMMGAAYVVRMIISRDIGLDAAGLFQSAWTLGGLYVGIILQAMGADFYPRLVSAATDNPTTNRIVNEQALVSMLLAGPGILATITFAPLVIALFYTTKFVDAIDVLRWICLGVALRILTWPIGYIIVAKSRQGMFLAAELSWTVVNIALTIVCVRSFGLNGAGIAFFMSYVFHGLLVYPMVRALSGFRWSSQNLKTAFQFLASIGLVFGGFQVLPQIAATVLGTIATIASGIYGTRAIIKLVDADSIPRPLARLLRKVA